VSDTFDKDANNLLPCNHAMSVGHSDVSKEINGGDGNKPECPGDEMMNAIKDGIIGLIHKSDTI